MTSSETVKTKRADTLHEKYGVDNVFAAEVIKDKIKQTLMAKHGVEYCMQVPAVRAKAQKSAFRTKTVILEGRVFYVQGYEDRFLRNCGDFGITVAEIADDVPTIKYKTRCYFPDFYVPSKNLIVEIKSGWTARGKEEFRTNIAEKIDATVDAGYDVLLIVYSGDDRKKHRLTHESFFYRKTLSNESGRTK